jgi:hypothetical protein
MYPERQIKVVIAQVSVPRMGAGKTEIVNGREDRVKEPVSRSSKRGPLVSGQIPYLEELNTLVPGLGYRAALKSI